MAQSMEQLCHRISQSLLTDTATPNNLAVQVPEAVHLPYRGQMFLHQGLDLGGSYELTG
jgi:hypothetical protein